MDITSVPSDQIIIGPRHRKDLGDLASLAACIKAVGLLQPIGVTSDRELIFGRRRLLACRDFLGWDTIPARVLEVASVAQGEFAENMMRKEYSPSERVAIVDALRGYSHGGDRKSDRGRDCDVDLVSTAEAARLTGYSRDSYFRARRVVERGVPELIEAMDRGSLSIHAASLIAEADPDEQRATLAKGHDEKRWVVRGVQKRLKRIRREVKKREDMKKGLTPPQQEDLVRLYHCPFQRLEKVAMISPGTVDLICTDIPYDGEFLPQLVELAELASRLLKPGGILVTYSGHYYLDQVIGILGTQLTYAWVRESRWTGTGNINYPRNVTSHWKPVLVYSKGDWVDRPKWYDVFQVTQKEKEWHDWQQPLDEVERLVLDYSDQGDLVVDPCGGGFTTAVACQHLGRRCIACDIEELHVIRGQERLALDNMGRQDNSPVPPG